MEKKGRREKSGTFLEEDDGKSGRGRSTWVGCPARKGERKGLEKGKDVALPAVNGEKEPQKGKENFARPDHASNSSSFSFQRKGREEKRKKKRGSRS